jgi:hypothetical protein
MSRENALAALIHDELGQTLSKVFAKGADANPLKILPRDNETLLGQLTAPGDGPPKVTLSFGLDIIQSSVATLLDTLPTVDVPASRLADLFDNLRGTIKEHLHLFDQRADVIARLIAARDPVALRAVADDLFHGVLDDVRDRGQSVRESMDRVRALLGNEAGGILPLATLVRAGRALENIAAVPEKVEGALLDYFFRSAGYQTIDGESVVAPVHLSDVRDAVAGAGPNVDLAGRQLRGLFSKATAERYLRDATRIVVESAFDAARDMNARYLAVTTGFREHKLTKGEPDRIVKKFVAWLRGFSSMAESAAMRAVEVGTQGVSEFQTNPLIAAAAGSFAGTAARKLAQDFFLGLLQTELAAKN